MAFALLRAWAAISAAAAGAGAFNLDAGPGRSTVIRDPRPAADTLFGHATAFWTESTWSANRTWLVVGAPGAASSDRPGSVFRCALALQPNQTWCQPMPVPGSSIPLAGARRRRGRDWLGASVAAEDGPNGAIAACAPRAEWTLGPDILLMPGGCYVWTAGVATPLPPFATAYAYNSDGDRSNGFLVGLAQEGMSAHFVKGTGPRKLLVGAPGVNYWRGSYGVYEWGNKRAPALRLATSRGRNHTTYYGYAVCSARLHRSGSGVTGPGHSLLVSAPRADGDDLYTGVVTVSGPANTVVLNGKQMGEYFGHCLAAVDLDGDGVDDLVAVGAPLAGRADEGRLYLYANRGEGRLEASGEPLAGSRAKGARFGSSVAGLGDLNRDGYADVAVGAPLEGGTGAVYVYLGRGGGLEPRPSQRLTGSSFEPPLAGFGASLAGGIDVDANSFNDLAVGASGSASVVVLLGRPVVTLRGRLAPATPATDARLALDTRQFAVHVCLRYGSVAKPGTVAHAFAEVRLRVDEDLKRAVLRLEGSWAESPRQKIRVKLARDVERCEPVQVVVKRHLYHVVQPIEISMEARVLDDSSQARGIGFECDGLCAVTDPKDFTRASLLVPFAHGCRGQNACRSDLKVTATTSNNGAAVVVGRDARVCVYAVVENGAGGDPAYRATLAAAPAAAAPLLRTPPLCALGWGSDDRLTCALADPLAPGRQVPIDLELDLRRLSPASPGNIVVNLTAWSASEELRPTDNSVTVKIPVTRVSHIKITGLSVQNYVTLSTKRNEDSVTPVYHRYEVVNHGPSPVEGVSVRFHVPVGVTRDGRELLLVAKPPNSQVNMDGKMTRCEVDALHPPETLPSPLPAVKRRRTRREVGEEPTGWRVLMLNCSEAGGGGLEGARVRCATITCPAVDLARFDVHLQLYYNASAMALLLNGVDEMQLFTRGLVKIEDRGNVPLLLGNSRLSAEAGTPVQADVEAWEGEGEVGPWLWALPLAIALGLLAFLVIVLALSNIGFFKREIKERMDALKGSGAEDEIDREELLEPMDIY